jgi:Predicted nucleic-acid-binding protein, contains PIN domain
VSDVESPAFVDTNVLVRHLTGDPPGMARRATRHLRDAATLLLVDVVAAEVVFVLESYYRQPRAAVATAIRSMVGFRSIRAVDPDLLYRAVEVYEHDRLDFPEAYLVAAAERSGANIVVSFDRSIDRVRTVQRIEPT